MNGRQRGGRFPVEDGWTKVERWRKKSKERWETKLETTFYVENLPDAVTNNTLWKSFGKVGRLSDAYVAKKKDAVGNKFGFLRFLNVRDINGVLERANEVRVLESVVKVTLARFDRNHRKFEHHSEIPVRSQEVRRPFVPPIISGGLHESGRQFKWGSGPSFKDVLNNQRNNSVEVRSVRLEGEGGLLQNHWIGKAVIGEGRNLESLTGIRVYLEKNGLKDVGICYMGGMKVMITFHDKKQALLFINDKKMVWDGCFESVRMWNGEELQVERVAYITIRGVPFQMRDEESFNKIGGMFGRVVGGSSFSWSKIDVSSGSCYVLVNRWEKIDEVINVEWRDRRFEVKVSEEGEVWKPEFEEGGGLEDGELRHTSPENSSPENSSPENMEAEGRQEGDSGSGKVGGEGVGLGGCMHGEGSNNNGGTKHVKESGFEGPYGTFSMGQGEVMNKKRRRSGSFNVSLNVNVDPINFSPNQYGLPDGGLVFGANNGPVNGPEEASNAGVRDVEMGVAENLEQNMNERGSNGEGSADEAAPTQPLVSPEVAAEVNETIRVGAAIGVQLEDHRKEVEGLVSGDGVFVVNQ